MDTGATDEARPYSSAALGRPKLDDTGRTSATLGGHERQARLAPARRLEGLLGLP